VAVLCFYSKTDFWLSYCQISTDLDEILHKPIVVRNTLVADLDRDRRVGCSRPNQNDYVFRNTYNAPIETTAANRQSGG